MSPITENIFRLKKELEPFKATLAAVSKTKNTELISEAYHAGQKIFAENYVQELVDKQNALPKDIEWHFIGHLQSNKVKYIAPFVSLIHSVDSFKLLCAIDKTAAKNNRIIKCLLQIFIAQEETKFGFLIDEARELLQSGAFQSLNNICITGLMAMATNTTDENQIRKEFRSIKSFFDELQSLPHTSQLTITTLSTGMSSDYKIALEEGSTIVRIGSLIFGKRIYDK